MQKVNEVELHVKSEKHTKRKKRFCSQNELGKRHNYFMLYKWNNNLQTIVLTTIESQCSP